MSAVITVTDHWTDGKRVHVTGSVATSGNYTTGGVTISFNVPLIKSASVPTMMEFFGQGVNGYKWLPGTTIANGKIKGITSGAEFTGGAAWPSDTITFYGIFPKFI